MNLKVGLILMGLAAPFSAFAGELPGGSCSSQGGEVQSLESDYNFRLFHADGEHQCWSKDYIGYKCTVAHAAIYTDCNVAYWGLKRDNCCSRMMWKGKKLEDGRSIDFKVTKCTNWT